MSRNRLPIDRSRPRAAGLLLPLGIALITGLVLTAPLAHAHLDAVQAAAHGLCGEHAPTGDTDPDPCSLCLAGSHAPAAPAPAATAVDVAGARPAPAARARAAAALPARGPGAPRAPPASA